MTSGSNNSTRKCNTSTTCGSNVCNEASWTMDLSVCPTKTTVACTGSTCVANKFSCTASSSPSYCTFKSDTYWTTDGSANTCNTASTCGTCTVNFWTYSMATSVVPTPTSTNICPKASSKTSVICCGSTCKAYNSYCSSSCDTNTTSKWSKTETNTCN